jgi:hypothetical protein
MRLHLNTIGANVGVDTERHLIWSKIFFIRGSCKFS